MEENDHSPLFKSMIRASMKKVLKPLPGLGKVLIGFAHKVHYLPLECGNSINRDVLFQEDCLHFSPGSYGLRWKSAQTHLSLILEWKWKELQPYNIFIHCVICTSATHFLKLFHWVYGFSESMPWKVGNSWMVSGLKLNLWWLMGRIMHEGVVYLGGCRYFLRGLIISWSMGSGSPWSLPCANMLLC